MSYDKEPVRWITVNGKHIPIFKGQSKDEAVRDALGNDYDKRERDIEKNKREADKLNGKTGKATADKSTQAKHARAVKELSDSKYEDGTYDIDTKKPVEFNKGYQVTFSQIGDNYTPEEYAQKCNECLQMSSDGKTYAGKFEGSPEISFHFDNLDDAINYGFNNNQISIWDWRRYQEAVAYEKAHPEDIEGIMRKWDICNIYTGGTGERKK